MKLLTKELRRRLPKLYSQEEVADPIVRAHFFNPTGQGDWWITEGQDVDEDGIQTDDPTKATDYLMFGLCKIFEPELGYVSLNELQSVRLPFGLGIERDLHWTLRPLSTLQKREPTEVLKRCVLCGHDSDKLDPEVQSICAKCEDYSEWIPEAGAGLRAEVAS